MVSARRLWLRLQTLFRRHRIAQRLHDEIQFHLDQQIAESIAAGMTREEALESVTIWPAYAGFQETVTGSLTPGKYADFVILDRDIMTAPVTEILGTRVIATYIAGKAVYERTATGGR